MAQMSQILDDLRERYGELRGLERRSDDLLKQVVDRFYVVEGLNRLQTELDCLDLLVKHKGSRISAANSISDIVLDAADISKSNSKLNLFKTIFHRSKKATLNALGLLKTPLKKDGGENARIAGNELRKITRLQRTKLSELMTIVRSTIVTNYGVLEQLQLLYDMHDKNMVLWQSIRRLAESILPPALEESNGTVEPVEAAVEQRCEIDAVAMGEGIIVGKASDASIKSMQQAKLEVHIVQVRETGPGGNKTSQTEVLYERNNVTSNNDNNFAGVGDVGDVSIGDGQTITNPNAMTQTLTEVKATNSSETLCAAADDEEDAPKNVHSMKKALKSAFATANHSEIL